MPTDIEKGLPVRTEDDAQGKVQAKICDADGDILQINTDSQALVEVHGNRCDDTTDVTLRLSELGDVNSQGDYDATNNSCPSSTGLIGHDRGATPDETDQNVRLTGVTNGDCHALDVAIKNSDGSTITTSSPLPVVDTGAAGAPICDFREADTAAAATDNHDLVVANGDTYELTRICFSASSRAKWEIQVGDGAASEVFTTKAVCFTTESNPCGCIEFGGCPPSVTGTVNGTTIRVIRTNRDDDDTQCLNSTIMACDVT